jgi:hypothetical protein
MLLSYIVRFLGTFLAPVRQAGKSHDAQMIESIDERYRASPAISAKRHRPAVVARLLLLLPPNERICCDAKFMHRCSRFNIDDFERYNVVKRTN